MPYPPKITKKEEKTNSTNPTNPTKSNTISMDDYDIFDKGMQLGRYNLNSDWHYIANRLNWDVTKVGNFMVALQNGEFDPKPKKTSIKPVTKSKKLKDGYTHIYLLFEYQTGKTLKFKYTMEKENYETFYNIVQDFFTDELPEEFLRQIAKIYPDYKHLLYIIDDDDCETDEYNEALSLKEIFDVNLVVDGIKGLDENTYQIQWSI